MSRYRAVGTIVVSAQARHLLDPSIEKRHHSSGPASFSQRVPAKITGLSSFSPRDRLDGSRQSARRSSALPFPELRVRVSSQAKHDRRLEESDNIRDWVAVRGRRRLLSNRR
jgi:hypothetical protein